MQTNLHPLCDTVQYNCNIADARYASDYTLCVYLLKMREYYRWEKGFSCRDQLSRDDVGTWVAARENLWESLAESSYSPIEIDSYRLDPFDTDNINTLLLPRGYVYSGGLGLRAAPHFFLGKLAQRREQNGFSVLISADECARDLTAPPAMTLGQTIFIRKESLRRLLWERIQEWQWNRHENAMARALAYYDIDSNVDAALDQLTDVEIENVIAHEIGEALATQKLGNEWREMVASLPRSKTELMVRAVKDLFADAISTLPEILSKQAHASLHFHAASLTAMRKELYPSFLNAYQLYLKNNDLSVIHELVERSKLHWQSLALTILDLFQTDRIDEIESVINSNRL